MNDFNAESFDSSVTGDNPYQAPQTPFEPSLVSAADRRIRWFRAIIGLKMLTIAVGVAAAFLQIESIIVSGATVTFLGVVITIMSIRHSPNSRSVFAIIFGLSGPVISAICFLLINLNSWSPSAARQPVCMIALSYGLISLPFGFVAGFYENRKTRTSATLNAPEYLPDDLL